MNSPAAKSGATSPTEVAFIVGFFFGFRQFIMLLSVRVLGTEPDTGTAISLGLNLLLALLVAFHCFGNTRRTLRSILQPWSVRWALIFLASSGCSLTWTVAASTSAAAAYWSAMAADVFMVALLIRTGDTSKIAFRLMSGFVWGACVVSICAWLLPAQSDLRLGDEELLGPNQIGYLCAFALFFVQYLMRRKQGNWIAAAVLLGTTLLRTLSKTTLVAFIIAELFLFAIDSSMRRKTKALLIGAAGLTALAFSSLLSSYYDVYTSAGNSPETLTGRLGIWAYILNESLDRPWFGHGFYSVWKVIPAFGMFEARHAHNELLQQFYSYGVVGVFIMICIYLSFYLQIRRVPDKPLRAYFLALLVFVLIRGVADTEICDLSLPLWAILLFTTLMQHAYGYKDRVTGSRAVLRPNCHPIVIS